MTKKFNQKQSDLTEKKILFYETYITGYLAKVLMGFGQCIIADLFCGSGKNGDQDGSALVLIKKIQYLLTTKQS